MIASWPMANVVVTAPTGHTYRTEAHGGALFPALAQPTGEPGGPSVSEPSPQREVMMPTRRQTREQDRRDRITKERQQRQELIADQERKEREWLAANYQPPSF